MKLKGLTNFVNILKVGYKCRKSILNVKNRHLNMNLLNFFYKRGFISYWRLKKDSVDIGLRYINNQPIFTKIKIVSRGGFRRFIPKRKNIKYLKDNIDIILFTSKGLLSLKEAQTLGIGGEVFFIIYY
jgi:ribosomal protein S8